MSLPAGYVRWCQAHGLNAWHPDEWPAAGLTAFQTWKQDLTSARLHSLLADGRWDLLSLDRQADLLAEHAAFAQAPPPSRPYRSCPCHMYTPVYSGPPDALPSTVGACLTWLEQTFSGRPIRRLRQHR
jgi:hypothetical protein